MATSIEFDIETFEAVEAFLDDLRSSTGVSAQFLEAARPIVCRLFCEVSDEDREPVMEKVRETVCRHAVVEFGVRRAEALMAAALEDAPREGELSDLDDAFDDACAASFFLAAHGGFGGSEPASA